ncbi:MAG TPA: ABC transporter permease [Acetobacteraceae bacterium]|nr:ABC transporter permease [Acetobacteraceae bacterium]
MAGRLAAAALAPLLAVLASMVLFGAFLFAAGVDPLQAYGLIWLGAWGSWFSWQNTLVRAAPILLTGLCMALPAQIGLVVIGAEGAFVLGGLGATAAGLWLAGLGLPPLLVQIGMGLAGIAVGGALIAGCGALRQYRGVNETISSLLIAYIAIAVMNQLVGGVMRDPASLNRPSTRSLPDAVMLGNIPGTSVHVGLIFGVVACIGAWWLVYHTRYGFAARVVGGNARAGRVAGLPVGRLILSFCFLAGGAAGLAGMVEVAAVQGAASADLATGAGYTGILAAFLARQNPLALIPVCLLLGGLDAAGGLLQQRLDVPDATMMVLRGVLFLTLLASESLQGRISLPRLVRPRLAPVAAAGE